MSRLLVLVFAALVGLAALAGTGSVAGAVENPDYTAPPPSSVTNNSVPTLRQTTSTSTAATPSTQRLAITGAETTQLVAIGGVLVAAGAVTLVVRRRVA